MKGLLYIMILFIFCSCSGNGPEKRSKAASVSSPENLISNLEIKKLNQLVNSDKAYIISSSEIELLFKEGIITEIEKNELLNLAN